MQAHGGSCRFIRHLYLGKLCTLVPVPCDEAVRLFSKEGDDVVVRIWRTRKQE